MLVTEQGDAARRLHYHREGARREARSALGAGEAAGLTPRAGSLPTALIRSKSGTLYNRECRCLVRPAAGLAQARRPAVGVVCNPASVDATLRHVRGPAGGAPRCAADRDLRPAARVPIRRAGQHDRDAACPRRSAPGAGLFLYSETREPTAEMLRDLDVLVIDLQTWASDLHLYLHHGELPEGRPRPRPRGDRLRSAESDRWHAGRGDGARARFESFVGMYPIPMRHGMDDRRDRAAVLNEHFGIGRTSRSCRWKAGAEHVLRRDGPDLDHLVADIPTFDTDDGLSRRRTVRGHHVSEDAHHAALRARRRAMGRRRSALPTR